jgi:mono/diheme cytochrome c family protein
MPAWDARLQDAQVRAVAAYVYSLSDHEDAAVH